MSSPVERLEAWCDDESGALITHPNCKEQLTYRHKDRVGRVAAYRNIIHEYRTTEADYETNLDEYSEGAKHALLGVIAELADALNPEQENPK